MTARPGIVRTTADDLAGEMHAQADAAIAARGRFVVALAGGTTPGPLYRAVGSLGPSGGRPDGPRHWGRWTALLTDERFLPVGHPDRNDRMVAAALPGLAAAGRLVTVPDAADPDAAAVAYAGLVEEAGPLDLAVLGLGADGHTAGVFRVDAADTDDGPPVLGVHDAPEPFPQRVTLTLAALSAARQVWFVVDAADSTKQAAVDRLIRGEGHAARVTGRERTHLILLQPSVRAVVHA